MLLGLMFGVAGMGSSSAAVALPELAEGLGVGVATATWTISLYVLFLGVTTALYGRISDLVGIRLPMLVGVGTMAVGAVLAAVAPTFELLLVARVLQGAGAAAVPTLGVAILSGRYDGRVRGLALGRLAGVAAAMSALGPLVGGLVELQWGWRGVMALPALTLLIMPFIWRALTTEGSGARLDLVGAVLVTVAAAGLVLLVQSPSTGVLIAVVGGVLLAVGAPASAGWVKRRPHGFLPQAVVRNPTIVRSSLAAAAVPAAWFAHLVAVPAVLVHAGWSPWQVGLLLVPSAVVALLVPPFASRLMAAQGPARTLCLAALVAIAALLVVALGTDLVERAPGRRGRDAGLRRLRPRSARPHGGRGRRLRRGRARRRPRRRHPDLPGRRLGRLGRRRRPRRGCQRAAQPAGPGGAAGARPGRAACPSCGARRCRPDPEDRLTGCVG